MPNDTKYDLSAAATDQDFIRADMRDKIAYLSAHDGDFAKASKQDQMGYINFLLKQGPPTKESSLYDRLTAGYDPRAEELGPVGRFLSSVGGAIIGAPGAVAGTVSDLAKSYMNPLRPSETVGAVTEAAKEWATNPNIRKGAVSVLPEALGTGVGNVAAGEIGGELAPPLVRGAGKAAKAARELPGNAGEITAKVFRDESGKLRSVTKAGAKLAGAAIGHATGIPEAGIAGYLAAPEIAEAVIPKRTPTVAPAVPVSRSPGPYRGPASVPKPEIPEPPPINQFPGATSSRTPIGNQPLPAVPQGTPVQFPPVEGVTSTAPAPTMTRGAGIKQPPSAKAAPIEGPPEPPLAGTPEDWATYDWLFDQWQAKAKSKGMYYAAHGKK